jgi:hypothetical protein
MDECGTIYNVGLDATTGALKGHDDKASDSPALHHIDLRRVPGGLTVSRSPASSLTREEPCD